jgi:hypothetical protein
MHDINPPTPRQFVRGCRAFEKNEVRQAMYKIATFLVQHFWGRPAEMADSLGVLLLTWNQAFYRYGPFDYRKLQRAIELNIGGLKSFRKRDIRSYSSRDDRMVKRLFRIFLNALQISRGSQKGNRSPVAVAKALHLLAPRYFPLWDDKIARAYHCYYHNDAAQQYLKFIQITRSFAEKLCSHLPAHQRPFTKLFDEYNYARFTKSWIANN